MNKELIFVSGIIFGILMCALVIHFNDDEKECEVNLRQGNEIHTYIGVLK